MVVLDPPALVVDRGLDRSGRRRCLAVVAVFVLTSRPDREGSGAVREVPDEFCGRGLLVGGKILTGKGDGDGIDLKIDEAEWALCMKGLGHFRLRLVTFAVALELLHLLCLDGRFRLGHGCDRGVFSFFVVRRVFSYTELARSAASRRSVTHVLVDFDATIEQIADALCLRCLLEADTHTATGCVSFDGILSSWKGHVKRVRRNKKRLTVRVFEKMN